MRLIIDMDEVLVQMVQPMLDIYNQERGTSLSLDDITQYDLSIYPGMQDIFKRPGFFRNLKPYPGAIEALRRLKHHEIVIATNHMGIDHIREDKFYWLLENVTRVTFAPCFTARKDNLGGDLIIDDCPVYLEAFPGITVCMDRPYNRCAKADYRVSDMWEFCELIRRMEVSK